MLGRRSWQKTKFFPNNSVLEKDHDLIYIN
jgi:hypothetical protein